MISSFPAPTPSILSAMLSAVETTTDTRSCGRIQRSIAPRI